MVERAPLFAMPVLCMGKRVPHFRAHGVCFQLVFLPVMQTDNHPDYSLDSYTTNMFLELIAVLSLSLYKIYPEKARSVSIGCGLPCLFKTA